MCHCIFGRGDLRAYECASDFDDRGYDRLIDTMPFSLLVLSPVPCGTLAFWEGQILDGVFFFPSEEESWVIGNNLQMLLDLSSFWKANGKKKKKKKKRTDCGKWHTRCVFQVTEC